MAKDHENEHGMSYSRLSLKGSKCPSLSMRNFLWQWKGVCPGPATQTHFSAKSIKEMRTDELAPLVKCLLSKQKGPEFNPQEPLNKGRHSSEICNFSLGRQRQEDPLC